MAAICLALNVLINNSFVDWRMYASLGLGELSRHQI